MKVSISLVGYNPDISLLKKTIDSLLYSLEGLDFIIDFFYIENSISLNDEVKEIFCHVGDRFHSVNILSNGENVGFGVAHNSVLPMIDSEYHLILNPDLELDKLSMAKSISFMTNNHECGLLTPFATWGDGEVQRLCKRYPSVFDLVLRGFAPSFIKRFFDCRLASYEMADILGDDVVWDPLIVSGCFMLFRTEIFKTVGGFDSRFFLYFEDFDISLRTAQISRIAYVPQVKVVHHGGRASRKGWKHIKMFGRSMVTFFNIHGWRWW